MWVWSSRKVSGDIDNRMHVRLSLNVLSAPRRLNGLDRLIGGYQGSMPLKWFIRIDVKQSAV